MNNANDTFCTLLFALGFGISAIACLTLVEHQEWFDVRPVSENTAAMPDAAVSPTN